MVYRIPVFMILWALFIGCGGQHVWASSGLDASFGLNGRVAVELGERSNGHAVLVQPDGKILIAGSTLQDNVLNSFLLRFNSDGTLDPGFNSDGTAITPLPTGDNETTVLGLLSDGRIVAAGYAGNGQDRDLAVICYHPDGRLDRTFGDEGMVLTSIGNGNEEITAMTISPSDMITVAGSTEGTSGRILMVARYTGHGQPDDEFGEQGVSLIGVGEDATAEGILERNDGSFVLAGSYTEEKNSSAMMLVGLNADGTIDMGFGEQGVAISAGGFAASEGYGIATDEDNRLYVAGAVGLPGKRDAALFRFAARGMVDSSFGEQGVLVTPVSREDDVLYSVDVSAGWVAVSGFTTDAGTRQFLLLSCPVDEDTVDSPASSQVAEFDRDSAAFEAAPARQDRLSDTVKVNIGGLQVWNNSIRIEELQTSDSLHVTPTSAAADAASYAQAQTAADGVPVAAGRGSNAAQLQILTTAFSEGASVSYALASDRQGNRIAVGSAEGDGTGSMVVARFMGEDVSDRIMDRPGHRSSHIATTQVAVVTKNSVNVSVEIADAFGQDVVRRGVVFSIHPGPQYTGNDLTIRETPVIRRGMDALASFFLPEAVAAASHPSVSERDDRQGTSSDRLLKEGEVVASGVGTGAFSAVVDRLLPGTRYYMRAYASTAQGDVYYGNQINVRTADACFIATASFGTFLHPSVGILRDFRDTVLLRNQYGKWLVDLYYKISPPLADMIAGSATLRAIGRVLLLPWIGFSWLALQLGLGITIMGGLAGMVVLVRIIDRWLRLRHESDMSGFGRLPESL